MKRKLFTFALLTTMVAGGAFAQDLFIPGTNQPLPCEEIDEATCEYSFAAETEDGPGTIDVSEWTRTVQ